MRDAGKNPDLSTTLVRITSSAAFLAPLVGIAFLAATLTARFFVVAPLVVAPVWPAAGVLMLALIRLTPTRTALFATLCAFLGSVVGNRLTGVAPLPSFVFSIVNCVSALVGAALLRNSLGQQAPVNSIRGLLLLTVYGVGVANALGATCGAALVKLFGLGQFGPSWAIWWLSNALGILTIVPMGLRWDTVRIRDRSRIRLILEAAILSAAVVVLIFFAYGTGSAAISLVRPFLVFPLLVWAGLRFTVPLSAASSLVLTLLVVLFGVKELGTIGDYSALYSRVVSMQTFMLMAVFSSLIPAAASADRRRAEREVQLGKEEFQFALQAASAGSWSWKVGSPTATLGLESQQLLGLPATTLLEAFFERILPEDRDHVRKDLETAAAGGNYSTQFRIQLPDGSTRWIEARGRLIVRDDEPWMYGINHDITDRKRAEEALIRSEKLASVGRLAATVAHEINNPLELVMNSVYLAMLDKNLSPQSREQLSTAEQELERVAQLTRQTLGFYRENATPGEIDATSLVGDVLKMYAPKLTQRNIKFSYEHNGSVHIRGIAGEIRQVVSNIVANAIDASPEGGRLRVRTSSVRLNGNDSVRLTFADTGEGIRPENIRRIFEPFFTTKQSVGTGLGLWVSHEIVHRHNGKLRVRSRRGQGTVFSILLPRWEREAVSATETR